MTVHIDGIIFSLQRQGGISVYTHQLLRHLAAERVPAVLTLEAPTVQAVDAAIDTPLTVLRRGARAVERYRRCRVPASAALFHSSYYRRPAQSGVPTVVTVHDFTYERFSSGPRLWVHMAQKHAAIRSAQAVICISEATRQDLEELVGVQPGQQVHVIHNGVAETFRPLAALAQALRPYVLYVGERGGYKNFRLLLQAMASLPDFELHCVGGGALRPEELGVAPVSVRGRVRHLGFVDEEALNEHYNRAVCLAYPSSYEGFGIPVVEAMRAGCPVVCIDCKAVLEVGHHALTVAEAAAPLALADAIDRTCDTTYRNKIVAAGLKVAQQYSWHATHERTLQVYRSLGANLNARD